MKRKLHHYCATAALVVVFSSTASAQNCNTDVDCDDGRFFNGVEKCAAGFCIPAAPDSVPAGSLWNGIRPDIGRNAGVQAPDAQIDPATPKNQLWDGSVTLGRRTMRSFISWKKVRISSKSGVVSQCLVKLHPVLPLTTSHIMQERGFTCVF